MLASLVLCPQRWRFAVMCRLACWLRPVVRLLVRYKLYDLTLEGERELALKLLMLALIRHNIAFHTQLVLRPANHLAQGSGVLLLTCHFHLNRLFLRWLCEREQPVSIVTVFASVEQYVGRDHPLEYIAPDAQCLRRIRQRIKAGHIVYLTPEAVDASATFHHPVSLGGQSYYLSDTALRFAEQANLPIVFAVPTVARDGHLIVKLARPSSQRAEIAVAEFCQFLSAEVAGFSDQ